MASLRLTARVLLYAPSHIQDNTYNGLCYTSRVIDTGATVSTVSQTFYEQHLTHLPLCQMSSILNIECADGYYLPYLGYIEVNISVTPQPCLLLVVNNNNYNSKVSIILGTNVMSHCLNCFVRKNMGKGLFRKPISAFHGTWHLNVCYCRNAHWLKTNLDLV